MSLNYWRLSYTSTFTVTNTLSFSYQVGALARAMFLSRQTSPALNIQLPITGADGLTSKCA
jgi:hypothetical protein